MIAKIKKGNIIYNSVIFGFIGKGWETKAVVFNENLNDLEIIKYWDAYRRCIFVVDDDKSNWIKKHNFEGYDWVFQNLKNKFFRYKIETINIIDKCIELQKNIKDKEWCYVKNTNDIKSLKAASLDFHDAYVEKMYEDVNKLVIEFKAWECKIILELMNDYKTNLCIDFGKCVTEDGYLDMILDCNLFFENEYVYWANRGDVDNSKSILQDENIRYFKSKYLRWKIII